MKFINCENISFSYDKTDVIDNISFEIEENDTVGIIGANGSGKTTLFKLLLGLEKPNNGKINIDEKELNKKNLDEIRKKVGFVFQDSDNQLFMNTVEDEIAFVLYNKGLDEKVIKSKVDNILDELDIKDLRYRRIIQLSGGEKKLVAIASILVMEPEVLLLDEPTNALDPRYRRRIIELLNKIKCTKIIASHDLDMISKTCSKTIFLYKGKIVKEWKTTEILTHEKDLIKYGL